LETENAELKAQKLVPTQQNPILKQLEDDRRITAAVREKLAAEVKLALAPVEKERDALRRLNADLQGRVRDLQEQVNRDDFYWRGFTQESNGD